MRPLHTAYVNGFTVTACGVLKIIGATFANFYQPLAISGCGTYIAVGCSSSGTGHASVSNAVSGVTGEAREINCVWDKPAHVSTWPQFAAWLSSGTYNSASPTDVTGWSETFDDGGDFDPTTGVFTAPVPGRYRFSWHFIHSNSGTANDRWTITLECSAGADPTWTYIMRAAEFGSVSGSDLVSLAAGTTVKLTITRSAGTGDFAILADGNASRFCGELLRS